MTKIACCTLFQVSWPKECSCVIDNVLSIIWCWSQHQCLIWPNSHVTPNSDYLHSTNALVPLIMLIGDHKMLMLMPVASHDQKDQVASNFDHLDIKMEWCNWWHCWHHMPLTSMNVVTWPKKLCCTLCQSSWCQEYSKWHSHALLTMQLASHNVGFECQQCQMTEKSCCISFWSSWSKKMHQCYWWCHQCHVVSTLASHNEKVMLHLVFRSSWPSK